MTRWVLVAVVGFAVLLAGCGDGGSSSSPTTSDVELTGPADATSGSTAADGAAGEGKPEEGDAVDGGRDRGGDSDQGAGDGEEGEGTSEVERAEAGEEATAAYMAYIDAIDARDGAALCDLLAPSAVRELKPPVERASCSASLRDSIGYEDPRGFPVWRRTRLTGIEGAQVSRDLESARITAAITTEFADRSEPSVESDIAYLELVGGEWRLAKPPGSLYRAVGNAELPPSVIVPPKG